MKRRTFTKLAGLSAVAVSTSGWVQFNGTSYVGDCETTTDILGPFYRPDSPVRDNLVIKGAPGDTVELSGIVRHKDCMTPYKDAKVELWHCSSDEVYDNDSDEYRYRGTTFCDAEGRYSFTTQMPVPYDAGGGLIRPAHFHIMISAHGYQSLITQIYFQGDAHLSEDTSSASPQAKSRILEIGEQNGIKKVTFDCNMNDRLKASYTALNSIVGTYKNEKDGKTREFFAKDDELWQKNEVFGESYVYTGNNVFETSGMPPGLYEKLHFKLKKGGKVKLTMKSLWEKGKEVVETYTKV